MELLIALGAVSALAGCVAGAFVMYLGYRLGIKVAIHLSQGTDPFDKPGPPLRSLETE